MTNIEFAEWFEYHCAAFTGIPEWLAKRPSPKPTMDRWMSVLQNMSLSEAKLATDLLFAQEEQPRGFDRHPAAIASIARKNRAPEPFRPRQIIDGQETFRCLTCRDLGYLICWHPEQMRHFRDRGELSEKIPNTCAKACTCAAGDEYARGYGRFDQRRWLPYLGDVLSVNLDRLVEFLNNSQDSRREKAFDAFKG